MTSLRGRTRARPQTPPRAKLLRLRAPLAETLPLTHPRHPADPSRLAALARYGVLDTPPEQDFDDLARVAAYVCGTPIALVSLVDRDRQWFKAEVGLGLRETPLSQSICRHAMLEPGLFVVPDARQDERFASNPLVTGPTRLRFYAGAVLETEEGLPLGTLCVLDHRPRTLDAAQQDALRALARQVMTVLELRRLNVRQSQMLEDLRRTQEQLKVLAATDALTGLANRRAFHDRLKQEQALIDRKGLPASLLMMDLDHFKHINDTYGHPAGDEVLRHFARLCGQVFRASDLVARWGGEEFIALLPRTTLGEACCVAERLRQALAAQPVVVEGGVAIPATTSIGVTEMAPLQPLGQTLRELDERLYAAKTAGRNTVVGDTGAGHPRDA